MEKIIRILPNNLFSQDIRFLSKAKNLLNIRATLEIYEVGKNNVTTLNDQLNFALTPTLSVLK